MIYRGTVEANLVASEDCLNRKYTQISVKCCHWCANQFSQKKKLWKMFPQALHLEFFILYSFFPVPLPLKCYSLTTFILWWLLQRLLFWDFFFIQHIFLTTLADITNTTNHHWGHNENQEVVLHAIKTNTDLMMASLNDSYPSHLICSSVAPLQANFWDHLRVTVLKERLVRSFCIIFNAFTPT